MMRMLRLVSALLVLFPAVALPQCGGEERWPVKVGGDARASEVDLTHPRLISLHDLVAVKQPPGISKESPRTDAELSVYILEARLVQFKRETGKTGDDDYHLVISDDTLQFSPGGKGTKPSAHSVIAEVVNPDCISGRKGTDPDTSHFQEQLANTRQRFEARFPKIVNGWNEGDGVPVRITAVGFFDRPHDQTGRAPNGIELHPILNIDFLSSAPGTTTSPSLVTEVVKNPGFEDGDTSWEASVGVISTAKAEPAKTGRAKAWLGGEGKAHTDTLAQNLTLPNGHAVSLTFALHITTEEQETKAFDILTVRLIKPNGAVVKTLGTFSNLNARPDFQIKTFDISAFAGQNVRLQFTATEDTGSLTSFIVDDVKVVVE